MSEATSAVCYSCGLSRARQEGTFGHYRLTSDGGWTSLADDQEFTLCDDCCGMWLARLDAGVRGDGNGVRGRSAARACDGCFTTLVQDCVTLSVLPAGEERASRSAPRKGGQIRSYSFCAQCAANARNSVWPGSLRRQEDGRAVDGGEGTGIRTHNVRFESVGLSAIDEALVRAVSARVGANAPTIAVVSLNAGRRAIELLRRLPPEERRSCIVAATPAQTAQVRLALQLGVADFLVTPFTAQQLLSGGDRAVALQPERHPLTGLAILDKAPARSLASGHLVTFSVPGRTELNWALALKRLLRGYDTIGMSTKGELSAAIYCPDQAIEAIIARLRWAMGREVTITARGRTPAAESDDTRPQVLCIDDAPFSLKLIEAALSARAGMNVHAASTGLQGLALARTVRPALILLDLRLPDIHGLDVLRQLRAMPETAEIPVVILSADASERQRDLAFEAGALACFVKPFDVPSFVEFVEDAVRARSTSHAA